MKVVNFFFLTLIFIFPIFGISAHSEIDLAKYAYVDPHHLIPDIPLKEALAYYDNVRDQLKNRDYLTVIDYSQHSFKKRFYLIYMPTGDVETFKVAHGSGSDPDHTGYATKFSNIEGSKMTSLGFYLTDETYYGNHGLSLYIDGISTTNSNARERSIVVHGAEYVNDEQNPLGRSWGCPALDQNLSEYVIKKIKNGSLMYAWSSQHQK